MNTAQVRSLSRYLLPHLPPGFRQQGWLLYATPMEHVLRAFCFDRSGFDKETFYFHVFVLPLYVPTSHVHLSFGDRLRCAGGEAWNVNNPNLRDELLNSIQREGLPFLEKARRPSQVAALVQQLPGNTNPPSLEAGAYSLAMADDYAGAHRGLDRLVTELDVKIPWQAEMMERARQLSEKLKANPRAAKQLLGEWEQITVRNLDL